MLVTIVNACLRDGRGGSPTAVLQDAAFTEAERCQVAERAGTSHAVFVTEAGADRVALRFFTSTGELPACGHGTIAALAFLPRTGAVELRTASRSFSGEAADTGDRVSASFEAGEVTLRDASAEERELARETFPGVTMDDVRAAAIGRTRLLVPLETPLERVVPDPDRLRAACDRLGLLGCCVHTAAGAGGRLAARMFAPSIGVPEDIANANSAACLAVLLAERHPAISVDMGDALGSPATITATSRGSRARVGGDARIAGTRRI